MSGFALDHCSICGKPDLRMGQQYVYQRIAQYEYRLWPLCANQWCAWNLGALQTSDPDNAHARGVLVVVNPQAPPFVPVPLCPGCNLCVRRSDGSCFVCDGPKEPT